MANEAASIKKHATSIQQQERLARRDFAVLRIMLMEKFYIVGTTAPPCGEDY